MTASLNLASRVQGCPSGQGHEWLSTKALCQCRNCKAVLIEGEAFYPASRILEVIETVQPKKRGADRQRSRATPPEKGETE